MYVEDFATEPGEEELLFIEGCAGLLEGVKTQGRFGGN